jgi:peroxiredoxin
MPVRPTETDLRAPDPPIRLGRRSLLTTLGALAASMSIMAPARPARAQTLAPLNRALLEVTPPLVPPRFSMSLADGTRRTLADYRGQGIVLNLWATWCVPCVAEMPALDGLAARATKFAIAVLPVSIDARGLSVVKPFYTAHHLEHLPILLDPESDVARAFKVHGIPATFIIDRQGRIVGRTEGPVEWDTQAAIDALRHLVGAREESG